MYFKCKNCGGNTIYSPERHSMFCPYCDSEKSEEREDGVAQEMSVCPNCGGEVPVEEHTSATQCPYCDSYLILNQRIEGQYAPKMIVPFQLGKETCKKSIREKFKRNIFAPTDFLSEVRLDTMKGVYVPYWFYDYDTHCTFKGEGIKIRKWTSGNTEYTETSYFDVVRDMDINFNRIPADASVDMPDEVMDLMEPYHYDQLIDFSPEYMSGFYAEKYNMSDEDLEDRAKKKMNDDATSLMKESYAGYSSVRTIANDVTVRSRKTMYGLLPVWRYKYTYRNKEYPFYVNGQTGKIVGNVPVSKKKVLAYTATLWGCLAAIALMIPMIIAWI